MLMCVFVCVCAFVYVYVCICVFVLTWMVAVVASVVMTRDETKEVTFEVQLTPQQSY